MNNFKIGRQNDIDKIKDNIYISWWKKPKIIDLSKRRGKKLCKNTIDSTGF